MHIIILYRNNKRGDRVCYGRSLHSRVGLLNGAIVVFARLLWPLPRTGDNGTRCSFYSRVQTANWIKQGKYAFAKIDLQCTSNPGNITFR